MTPLLRREFLRQAGLSAAVLPFISGLPSLALAAPARPRQRLIVVFSPNGTIPEEWRPDGGETDFRMRRILAPLEAHRERLLILGGLDLSSTRSGPGDGHQKGMGHVLTGVPLLPLDMPLPQFYKDVLRAQERSSPELDFFPITFSHGLEIFETR